MATGVWTSVSSLWIEWQPPWIRNSPFKFWDAIDTEEFESTSVFFVLVPSTAVNTSPHNSIQPVPCPADSFWGCSNISGEKLASVHYKWHSLPDDFYFLVQGLGLQCIKSWKKSGQKQREVGIKRIMKFTDFLKWDWQVGMFSDIIAIPNLQITLITDSWGFQMFHILTVQPTMLCMPLESAL